MQKKLVRSWLCASLFASSAALVACNVEDGSEGVTDDTVGDDAVGDEALGEAEQPFAFAIYQRLDVSGGTLTAPLGTYAGNASSLLSVAGNLDNGGRVQVEYLPGPGTTQLKVNAAGGALLRGDASIVGPAPMTAQKFYSNNSYVTSNPPVVLAPVSATTRCFLTDVLNGVGGQNFSNANDFVGISQSGGSWVLSGTGKVAAYARCATVTTNLGASFVPAGTWNLGGPMTGKSCWLTGIGGSFRNNNVNDGVIVRYNNTLLRWEIVVGTGKIGWTECNI